jgi:hypothetical protein
MMNLQDKLKDLKANFEKQVPKEALEIMHRATEDLQKSGIVNRIKKVGNTAPEFELPNTNGNLIRLQDLLSDGPLVLCFFRGKW